MIWGKNKNKMNANLSPQNDQERELVARIDAIKNSEQLQEILLRIKTEVEMIQGCKFSSRIKRKGSAIRRTRVNKSEGLDIDPTNDLCGIMITTDSLEQTYEIAEKVKEVIGSTKEMDLNNRVGRFGVAPLSYVVYSKLTLDNGVTVPIEVRIHEKNRFLTVETLYYATYKNDELSREAVYTIDGAMMGVIMRQELIDNR